MGLHSKAVGKGYGYPRLMKNDETGEVIFATGKNGNEINGFLVHQGKNSKHEMGEHSYYWDPKKFKPWRGKVVIETK